MIGIETNPREIISKLLKYILEGLAVAIAAYWIPQFSSGKRMNNEYVLTIAITAACMLAVLDVFAPTIGRSFRLGSGFGIGSKLVAFPTTSSVMPA